MSRPDQAKRRSGNTSETANAGTSRQACNASAFSSTETTLDRENLMTSAETTTHLTRSLRIQHLVRVVLLGLILSQLPIDRVRGQEDPSDPYDVLYDVIMTRYGKDGKSYAESESSPALFSASEFPFGDKTHKKFSAALDKFGALPQTKIEAYSHVKRALLQRHLWKVFDVTSPYRWKDPQTGAHRVANRNHSDRRAAVQPKIGSLIQRLALTRAQILALPDTQAVTVKSGGFAQRHDPTDPFKPFLPTDLYSKESSWVCIGTDETIPVDLHAERLKWRSAFYSFIRLPKGRPETLEYIENAHSKEQFPVGTQVALIEQAFLISDKGEMILSPLTVSISLRAYLNVNLGARKARPAATQCVAEFVIQPRQLMQGNAVLKAMDPLEHRFEASEAFICQDTSDPFETGRIPRGTRLNSCMNCHSKAGHRSVLTSGGAGSAPLFASSPAAISKVTSNEKRNHYTWNTLHELWRADSAKTGTQSPARADKPQPPLDNKDTSGDQRPAAARGRPAKGTADPYDVLYDVLMTRYGSDGKAYGANESSPSIFKESNFPFDDKTYQKFNAALDAFGAFPQEKIEAYSDIQRALMQRHLWHVFDATIPFRWIQDKSGQAIWSMSHSSRRDAVRPKIASLIQRLALTKAQILALPDTRAVTVESGGFSRRHDPGDPFKPFLSADLYSKESSWVGIGFDADPPAPFHQNKLKFRSAFLTFMRLPGGRVATLEYMKKMTGLREKREQFPVRTQFALIEQAFLISDEGEMILSPLIVSISLRAYLDVEQTFSRKRPPTQSVAEFVAQPRQLMQGNAVMKALGQRDLRFEAGDVDIHNEAVEPFENTEHVPFRRDEDDMLRRPRLTLCMSCHKTRGRKGVRSGFSLSGVKESSPEEIVKATLTYKRDHETWKTLSELWQADSKR
jgi:hypothetical protein